MITISPRLDQYYQSLSVGKRSLWRYRSNHGLWTLVIILLIVTGSILRPAVRAPVFALQDSWSQFAYASYATNDDSLCNSVMLFESLGRLGCKPDRILLHPYDWSDSSLSPASAALLDKLHKYGVQLTPITVQEFSDVDPTWSKGFTKLLAFNQTQYSRILTLDSDAIVLQKMDELFQLISSTIAMPRAYWLEHTLNAQIILLEPSKIEFDRIQTAYVDRPDGWTEMDVLNEMYEEHCLVIPHRPYGLVTGEFRHDDHTQYMGTTEWDPKEILPEAKFIHFSDWPLPKPWQSISQPQWDEVFPPCSEGQDCRSRRVWLSVYHDFLARRREICGEAFMPVNSHLPGLDP